METPFKLPLETYRPTQNHSFAGLYLRDKDGSLPIKIMPSTDMEERAVFVRDAVNSHASLTAALDVCVASLTPIASWRLEAEMSGIGPDHTNRDMLLDIAITLARAALEQARKMKG